ncbi:c-type cytochrome [Atopomonas hussainii]|uniref:c-type cytochrome n=1 Tax=Atopomonas hussainii TaxID=1429083 RepID=UPI0009001A25|nr:c-type cytochrome [Atopomonas hussainii]
MNLIKKILTAQAAVLALVAVSAQAASNDDIAARIKPVGEVCIQGEECKGAAVAAVAASASGPRSGEDVVAKSCNACHGAGVLGAPKVGDSADWKARADKAGGLDTLLQHAINGINAMPPKGTCGDCSDDELMAAIKHMSGL